MDRDFRLLAAPFKTPKNNLIGTNSSSVNANQVKKENEESFNICSSSNDFPTFPSNKARKGHVFRKEEAKKKWEILKRKASF